MVNLSSVNHSKSWAKNIACIGCLGFLHTSILVTLFTGSQFQTWRRIHEVTLYRDLYLQITHQAQERLATPLGSTSPTLFKQR